MLVTINVFFGIAVVVMAGLAMPKIYYGPTKIRDQWFYVTSGIDFANSGPMIRSDSKTVRIGQSFGLAALFYSPNEKVQAVVQLRVPNSPERFPSHTGKVSISKENNTVLVEYEVGSDQGRVAFQWGVGEGDPIGEYEMNLLLDGHLVISRTFNVLPSTLSPTERSGRRVSEIH
jgi:hypothetical protein